jgi:glycosyltransferase involved in cell wall biosynthesis
LRVRLVSCAKDEHTSGWSAMARPRGLQQLTKSLGIYDAVTFTGMVTTSDALAAPAGRRASVSVTPEFGSVVFEALFLGAVPWCRFRRARRHCRADVNKGPLTDERDLVAKRGHLAAPR